MQTTNHTGEINDPVRVNGSITFGHAGNTTSVNNDVEVNGHLQAQHSLFKKTINVNGSASFNNSQLEAPCKIQGTLHAKNTVFSDLFITGHLENFHLCKIKNLYIDFPKANLFAKKKRQIILTDCELLGDVEVINKSFHVRLILRGTSQLHGKVIGATLTYEK